MQQPHAYEKGTSEELVPYLTKHPKQLFRLVPITPEGEKAHPKGQRIYAGMIPKLKDLPEELFKEAEWHGEKDNF